MQSIGEGEIVRGTVLSIDDDKDVFRGRRLSRAKASSRSASSPTRRVSRSRRARGVPREDGEPWTASSSRRSSAPTSCAWDRNKGSPRQWPVVEGKLIRKIKGGVVDRSYGVEAFLPGSQIALRQSRTWTPSRDRRSPSRSSSSEQAPPEHRGVAPVGARGRARPHEGHHKKDWRRTRSARAWSRTSPTSVRSWTRRHRRSVVHITDMSWAACAPVRARQDRRQGPRS